MKAQELTIDVKAKVEVSRSTAEACLKLVELYYNDNSNIAIIADRNPDGTESFRFTERGAE